MFAIASAFAAPPTLPPVPVPAENPITEEKRVLGKILFWDEQLSSDNSIACGTCHKPGTGGSDDRFAANPGRDGRIGTDDDVMGSPGVQRLDRRGMPAHDPTYGDGPQVTNRSSPSYFAHLWADALFWDGRAQPEFRDPLSNTVAIRKGGALESQSLGPILNSVEMAKEDRDWHDVVAKLQHVQPLALARNIPADMRDAIARSSSYPSLFAEAFGDPAITPVRIAFAIASYERTLVADQTPWDLFDPNSGESPPWLSGLAWFERHECHLCHTPPLFTNNDFKNIGLRQAFEDPGRALVTGEKEQRGAMKVPTLRNVALRKRLMHTGTLHTLDEVLDLYANPKAPRDTLPSGEPYNVHMDQRARSAIESFLQTALTDPRVAAETFPFDRPTLRSELHVDDRTPPQPPIDLVASRTDASTRLRWSTPNDDTGVVDFVLSRNGKVIALPTRPGYEDSDVHALGFYHYRLIARDAQRNSSSSVAILMPPFGTWFSLAVLGVPVAVLFWVLCRRRRLTTTAR